MKKYKLQLILIGCGTRKLYEPTNLPIWYIYIFRFRTDEKMLSCHFIPNKVLYAVIFYDTQFYLGTLQLLHDKSFTLW